MPNCITNKQREKNSVSFITNLTNENNNDDDDNRCNGHDGNTPTHTRHTFEYLASKES